AVPIAMRVPLRTRLVAGRNLTVTPGSTVKTTPAFTVTVAVTTYGLAAAVQCALVEMFPLTFVASAALARELPRNKVNVDIRSLIATPDHFPKVGEPRPERRRLPSRPLRCPSSPRSGAFPC